jgi:hypothetical protein
MLTRAEGDSGAVGRLYRVELRRVTTVPREQAMAHIERGFDVGSDNRFYVKNRPSDSVLTLAKNGQISAI